ncbi:MAG: Holliday junction branch migration protein RuvA [Actinomycetota bacterium]
MISSLNGTVTQIGADGVEVEVAGVGYLVLAPTSAVAQWKVGGAARIITHMVVREDSMTLYGFESSPQRELFRTLITVTGVGPKLALSILSGIDAASLVRAVSGDDVDALTAVAGVGKRLAQRMILELKDKLATGTVSTSPAGSKVAQVREALVGLGYTQAELRGVLDRVGDEAVEVEHMVRAALKELSRV